MYKILIVEDDQFFREAISDILKTKYSVLEAPNGKSAKEILSIQNVNIVLTDIQMPGLTGLELLEWGKSFKPEVNFIVMTGFSAALETQNAFELGAKGFLAKPFKNSELFQTIEGILGLNQDLIDQQSKPPAPIEYCKVSIEEFVSKPQIDFDVFIKLSEDKIIKLAHKGQQIPKDKVELFKSKGLKHLYILRDDFNKLVNFNLNIAKLIKDRNDISSEKKLNFLKYTGEVILEKTFIDGVNKESFSEAKSFLDLTLNTITQSNEGFELLNVLNSNSDTLYAHSLGVSLYSGLIAKSLGIESTTTLFKISLAGLFHDIGKKEIDRELLEKPRHLVTREERKIIESHVTRGQEILNSMQGIHSDVVRIVSEHHEDLLGQGYPQGKKKFELHPLSKIIQCANIFVNLTLGVHLDKPIQIIISQMETLYEERLDAACINALRTLFK